MRVITFIDKEYLQKGTNNIGILSIAGDELAGLLKDHGKMGM